MASAASSLYRRYTQRSSSLHDGVSAQRIISNRDTSGSDKL